MSTNCSSYWELTVLLASWANNGAQKYEITEEFNRGTLAIPHIKFSIETIQSLWLETGVAFSNSVSALPYYPR